VGSDWVHLVRRPLIGLSYEPRVRDDECGPVAGMKIGRGNRSTLRKPVAVPLCPPQISRDLTWARARATNHLSYDTVNLWCTRILTSLLWCFKNSHRKTKSAMMKDAERKKWRKKKAIFLSVSPYFFVSCHQERATIHFLGPCFPVKCLGTKTFSLNKINNRMEHVTVSPGGAFCFVMYTTIKNTSI
jgi:hypothetical protein